MLAKRHQSQESMSKIFQVFSWNSNLNFAWNFQLFISINTKRSLSYQYILYTNVPQHQFNIFKPNSSLLPAAIDYFSLMISIIHLKLTDLSSNLFPLPHTLNLRCKFCNCYLKFFCNSLSLPLLGPLPSPVKTLKTANYWISLPPVV